MSDLIRREDAARIAEDFNLDIWEYSTGNRSRIAHDPVAEAIRALPAAQPVTAEALAQIIRIVDGNHSLGAGELAERILSAVALPAVSAKHDFAQPDDTRLRIALTDAESYLKRGLDKSALSLISSVLKGEV